MRLLIKLGGALLDDRATQAGLAGQLAAAAHHHQVVVVHGGGKQMTRFLDQQGVCSTFESGLRVTTPEVLDAVLKVFAGTVNHQLVAALRAAGARPVGLSGVDAGLTSAEPMRESLGAVGRIVASDAGILRVLTREGFLPIVACVAGDAEGRIYNVNADQMASAMAGAFTADRLIFLTDVPGVKDASGNVLSTLAPAAARSLIATGAATGGMQAKLTYALEALAHGAASVRIAPGAEPDVLTRILAGDDVGTSLQEAA